MTGTSGRFGDEKIHGSDEVEHGIVGDDRNVAEIVERLEAGGSVIVVGALGSGKSHFSRAIVSALRAGGADPVIARAAAPLTETPLGALQASGDARLARLADDRPDDRPDDHGRLLLVVDDAHALDPESLAVIARAVYTGRVTALLSVTADPAGALDVSAPAAITDLWLEGGAARYDLHPLDPGAAEKLITAFVGDEVFDTATRSALIVRAGGSRMLLRELSVEAASRVAAGRDPLDPTFEAAPGSRLSDAFASMIAEYTHEQRLTLALIGRLPGVAFADAARSMRPQTLDTLISRSAVHTDGSPEKHLQANPLLASEAERRLEPGRLDAALDAIARRALVTTEIPPGAPVDQLIAAAWYSSREGIPSPDQVSKEVRCRILASAARSANARGRADLALAYVRLGLETDGCPSLFIEASRAYTRLHRMPEAFTALTEHPASDLTPGVLRRLVRWWATLVTWDVRGEHTFDEIEEWIASTGVVPDAAVLAEIDQGRAEAAGLQMEWERAIELAAGVLTAAGVSPLTRVRASVVTGTALAELGRFAESAKAFAAAEYANRDAVTGRPRSTTAELAAMAFEAIGMQLAGTPKPSLLVRLRRAAQIAARRDDRTALTLANIVAGQLAGGLSSDPAGADREFGAALRRFDRVEFAAWRPIVAAFRAAALADLGRVDQAMNVFESSEDAGLANKRLVRFARQAVEAELLAAAGDLEAAREKAVAAAAIRREGGLPDRPSAIDQERIDRLSGAVLLKESVGEATESGLRLVRRDVEHDSSPGVATAARLAGLGTAPFSFSPLTPPGAGCEQVELTERELEVALLVAGHLSNKEIAQRLFLSVRTVESHVYTARGKLGARTRRELGRMVVAASAPAAASASATGRGR
ncbi:helix-turn-helix transcriptional regulator [Herbiconiux liukaitaii]|uniref:helix-turn-helix transcriptional regulator n=1 Tax=Herbiconiux liukaitaii TaxID=3342799 RepID=UPI0035B8E606